MSLYNQFNFTSACDAVRFGAVQMDAARRANDIDAWDAAREQFIKAQGAVVSMITDGLVLDPPAPPVVEEPAPAPLLITQPPVEEIEPSATDKEAFAPSAQGDLLDNEPAPSETPAATDSAR